MRFLPYLDLMCCGFGGALLMFLIVASAQKRVDPPQPMLVVRCRAVPNEAGHPPPPGGELGIEYRRFGTERWIRANSRTEDDNLVALPTGTRPSDDDALQPQKWAFLPRSAPGSPAEALLICRHPRMGKWEFRAYLADFPATETATYAHFPVRFEFLGISQTADSPSTMLLTPGTKTKSVTIEVNSTR